MAKNREKQNAESEEIIITTNKATTDGDIFVDKKRKKKPKKTYQKTTFKHKMKVLGVLTLLGVFTGSGLGVWYFNTAIKSNVDYNIDPATVMANVDDTFTKIGLTKENGWVEKAKANGLKPDSLSAVDNILLCEYNAKQASSWEIVGTGKAISMGITQTIFSEKKFDGNNYSFVSISKGMLTVATCDVMNKNGRNVTIYKGENPTENGATWKNPETVSSEYFSSLNGVMPSDVSPYIISEKTIDTASEIVYNSENGVYSFTLTLKPVESVLLYYKQVKRSGGLEADPEFRSIQITFNINENWDFVSTEITESYKAVKFGMPVGCDGTLLTNYSFDKEVILPV